MPDKIEFSQNTAKNVQKTENYRSFEMNRVYS